MNWRHGFTFLVLSLIGYSADSSAAAGAVRVEIVKSGPGYELLRAGKPYEIRGAGLEYGDMASFAAHGGNSIRNWTTDNAAAVLDTAQSNGITVALCLCLQSERWGFDYNDATVVAAQLELMRAEVLKYRDHPALLAWIIGNELNFDYTNSKVYDAVNDVSEMIHELDPNHPTTTAVAGLGENVVSDLEARAPDLDFYSFQVYGALALLPEFLQKAKFDKPIWITEWGAIGHWEVPKTNWGAPIEMTSTEKAMVYRQGFENYIEPWQGKVLGSYAFLWGQKQERTATWYGMFLESGEETETVDVMHWLWNGEWPENRSPAVQPIMLDGKTSQQSVQLKSGQTYQATIAATDHDSLSYRWELKPESDAEEVGGDLETPIASIDSSLSQQRSALAQIVAPATPGAYRLFVTVYDGNKHAAHANIPFLVTR
jgi:hypothetical protein